MDATASNTEGFWVVASATTAGDCHAQSAVPAGAFIVGSLVSNSTTSGSSATVTVRGAYVPPAAPSTADAFVSIGNPPDLSASRALTAGNGVTITDGGANSTVTVKINNALTIAECAGTFGTSVSAQPMPNLGGPGSNSCPGTAVNLSEIKLLTSRTFQGMAANCRTAGANTSDVFTLYRNGSTTSITCTVGTGSSCTTSSTQLFSAGDTFSVRVSTGSTTETLAQCALELEWN